MNVNYPYWFVCLSLMVWSWGAAAIAADFRVENKVFMGNEKEPVAASTTLFQAGSIYDYREDPDEVAIFDPPRGRFVLLDLGRRVKTELMLETINKAMEAMRQRLAASQDSGARFLGNPSFEKGVDQTTGELVFENEWMTYRVSGVAPADAELARQYREFSDAYARLNTFTHAQSRPPFARLIVNEALEQRGEIPMKVEMTVTLKKGFPPRRMTMRSEHHLIPRLVESDRRRIAQTNEFLALFKTVGFDQYQVNPKDRDAGEK